MRVTIDNVKDALQLENSYDIVNAIRNSASDSFKQYVPLANIENVANVGAGITVNQTVQNEFITSLIDRIGLVVIKTVSLRNPLKEFKKGTLPMGRTIEEIFVDITKEKQYNPREAEQKVFEREIPNVKTLFHELNRKGFYHQTVQDSSLKTAFVSWSNFDTFLTNIINAMYNSAEVDEFEYMKMLIDNYAAKGHFKAVAVDAPIGATETQLKGLVKKLRATARKMTLPQGSRNFNSMGVRTTTAVNDLHLFITADLEAELDVDVLASAFNMSKAEFMGNRTVLDDFATPGLKAVLVDKEFFMVYDNLQKMETIRNPRGLYWNYYYHVWQVMSTSRFANAVAFYDTSEATLDPVTEIVLTPLVASAAPGDSVTFDATVSRPEGVTVADGESFAWAILTGGTVYPAGTPTPGGTNIAMVEGEETTAVVTIGANEVNDMTIIYEWTGVKPAEGEAPTKDGRASLSVDKY